MIVVCRVTTKCNLECPFCAYDRRLPFQRNTITVESALYLGKLFSEYSEITKDKVLISWLGGEPFLWKDIFFVSNIFKNEYGLEVSVTTNGTTLHLENSLDAILKNFNELTISVDGFEEFHNTMRGFKNGWKNLKTAVSRISKLKESNNSTLKLRANILLMHNNIEQFYELCHELAAWGINEISFNQLGGRDRPEFFSENKLTFRDATNLNEIVNVLKLQLEQKGVKLCGSSQYLNKLLASSLNQPLEGHQCQPVKDFIFVDEKCRLSPCSFTSETHGVDLNTLKNGYDIVNLSNISKIKNVKLSNRECLNCPSTHVFKKFSV